MARLGDVLVIMSSLTIASSSVARTSDASAPRDSIDDAWWTGPLLAPSPATLPRGHFLIEPYLYDAQVNAQYDSAGHRHDVPNSRTQGAQTYVLYGLVDSVTTGFITRLAHNEPSDGSSTSGVAVGDLSAQASFRLSRFLDRGWLPAVALVIGETLPTGKYDRLGARPSDGVGAGANSTAVSIYSQYYFWMPNGRILRTRMDITQSWSSTVAVADLSVYGTSDGFRGYAKPGDSFTVDSAWEYSVTRHWVAALDIYYVNNCSTRVVGTYPQTPTGFQVDSGSSYSVSLAPAIEYNWSATVGVIAGVKWTSTGHNTSATVIPIIAVNLVF